MGKVTCLTGGKVTEDTSNSGEKTSNYSDENSPFSPQTIYFVTYL